MDSIDNESEEKLAKISKNTKRSGKDYSFRVYEDKLLPAFSKRG